MSFFLLLICSTGLICLRTSNLVWWTSSGKCSYLFPNTICRTTLQTISSSLWCRQLLSPNLLRGMNIIFLHTISSVLTEVDVAAPTVRRQRWMQLRRPLERLGNCNKWSCFQVSFCIFTCQRCLCPRSFGCLQMEPPHMGAHCQFRFFGCCFIDADLCCLEGGPNPPHLLQWFLDFFNHDPFVCCCNRTVS